MAYLGKCKNVDCYEKVNRIGEGTYGTVYCAKDTETGAFVALKRILLHNEEQDGFPITSLREIKLLKNIQHANIVRLLNVSVGKRHESVFLVFEYCQHDLGKLLDTMKKRFSLPETKRLLYQLLSAVAYMHERFIVHRDLKMSNLLYNQYGQLKVADFGLAREFAVPSSNMTSKVVTLWYRAPELLLGCTDYASEVDMWSCGCIFAELLFHAPLVPGSSEIEQMQLIFRLLGEPNEKIWPNMHEFPHSKIFFLNKSGYSYNNISKLLPHISASGIDLLNRMLTYDPKQRITAEEALKHPFFTEAPYPTDADFMPTFPSSHKSLDPKARNATQHNRNSIF